MLWYNTCMSGHSKWSTIKRQKGANDKARGQRFTKLGNSITIAVREGGSGDIDSNIRLRFAVETAKQANMPKDIIQRAIERGSGVIKGGAQLESVVYEGFASGGVAVLVEAVTDNKQRTAAIVKNTFSTKGGTLSGVGSVSYLFEKVGILVVLGNSSQTEILELAIEAQAQDFETDSESVVIYTHPQDLHRIKDFMEKKGLNIVDAEMSFRPITNVEVKDSASSELIIKLLEALDELDEVVKVHANVSINTQFLAKKL